jgi:hypothetical protein
LQGKPSRPLQAAWKLITEGNLPAAESPEAWTAHQLQ